MRTTTVFSLFLAVVFCIAPEAPARTWSWFGGGKKNLDQAASEAEPASDVAVEPSDAGAHRSAKKSTDAPRISVDGFNGSTGASAMDGLRKELLSSREFFVVNSGEPADFTVSGSSVGGRVTGKLVAQGRTAPLFERSYAAPGLNENVRALADDLVYTVTGKPGLATSRIVFVSDISGTKQIYLCRADGSDVEQLTRQPYGAVSPSLSPDASQVAFTSYKGGFPSVMIVDLAGGWERELSDTPGTSFSTAFSPDGRRIALVMSFLGNPEVFVTDLSSNSAFCITDTTGVPSSPSWHPKGGQLLFSSDDGRGPQLFVSPINEKGGGTPQLWSAGYGFCTDPEFSPDGSRVAFTARSGGETEVVVKAFPTGRARVVAKGGARHPSWSPNGRYLVYERRGDLMILDLETGGHRAVVTGYGRIQEPRWMK